MKWRKGGLIYGPDGSSSWAKNTALTPTPIILDEDTIRVYAGFRDDRGVSRIGYVDVDGRDPSKIKRVSEKPVLDVGLPGTFDDNGVILGDIIEHNGDLHMYYVGFQLVEKVKFLAFTGLAISHDKGFTFERYSNAPVLDRSDTELYVRSIHSVMFEDGTWKMWGGVGNAWEYIDGKPYPRYLIKYYETKDGIHFPEQGQICFPWQDNEYRIGRPRVYKLQEMYHMFYTVGTLDKGYVPGYAQSTDGLNWLRKDEALGIALSDQGWDSQMLCYPALIQFEDKTYMFYNGNQMGYQGFGYAILESW
jgi:predicted GH43/DUF377 family glycosyl hydrolase